MKKESWKKYSFPGLPSHASKLEVSDKGRVRVFSKLSDGKIVKGSLTEGYPRLNLKYFKQRTKEEKAKFALLRGRIQKEKRALATAKEEIQSRKKAGGAWKKLQEEYSRMQSRYNDNLKSYKAFLRQEEKSRTIYYGVFIHNLVAELFLKKPRKDQPFVIHRNFNKVDNNASNLRWVSQEELTAHNNNNPKVIKARKSQIGRPNVTAAKLKETDVKKIKQLLKAGKTLKEVAKRYKVSDMQIHRIRTGENWKRVKA